MSAPTSDPFFQKYFPSAPRPPQVPFTLKKGDRFLLIGDSITEAPRHAQMLETYLSVCTPELGIEVRNIGKGGETAEGFLGRIEAECLCYQPTVATVCYGMNDAGYVNNNREAADRFNTATKIIIEKLQASGTRLILASPGCMDRLPPWQFIHDLHGTLGGLNTSLLYIHDFAAAMAEANRLPFVDHFWNLYQARLIAQEHYGSEYSVCGKYDGVHPAWAGHLVMLYGYLKAFGLDGNLGNFTIDLDAKIATADPGHAFLAELDNTYTFTSSRYPFCADGLSDKDWSIRSGMTLVPFNRDFNRMTLKVTGLAASHYRVAWMDNKNHYEEWHTYTASNLTEGVNLAEDYHLNPFSIPFCQMDNLVFQKQGIEVSETWHTWEMEKKSGAEGLAACEAQRAELRKTIRQTFAPVTHNIRIEAVP